MSRAIVPADGSSRAAWCKGIAVVVVLLAYPLLIHWVVFSNPQSILGELLILLPLLLVFCWLIVRSERGRMRLVLLMVAVVAGGLAWHKVDADPALLYPVPHIAINLFMLWFFGRTLQPGREALITRVARYVHGSLPAEVAAYTRRVTWAWCVYFAATVGLSALLFAFAPLAVWSLFANVLSWPLLALMFFGENAWRILRHPHFERASLPAVVRAFRKQGESSLGPARGR